jgi:hypothetical protein
MGIDYLGLVFHGVGLFVCVMTFWRAAEMEEQVGRALSMIWGGMSAIVYLASWLIFGLSWPGMIAGQVLLLVAIGVVRGVAYMRSAKE